MKATFNYVHKRWKFDKYISNGLKTTFIEIYYTQQHEKTKRYCNMAMY